MCSLCKNDRADAHIQNKYIKNPILAPGGQVQVQKLGAIIFLFPPMVCSRLNMYLFELVASRSMEFPVIEKANYYHYQLVILYIRAWLQGCLKSLQRLFLSPAGFACRQGLVSRAASARHVLIATEKSRGHHPSRAVHHNYHLIKIKWSTNNWMSLPWLPRARALGRVPFIHTNKSNKSAVGKEINLWHEHEQQWK